MKPQQSDKVDMRGLLRALARVLNHCQFCGQRVWPLPHGSKPVDAFTDKFYLHKCHTRTS